MFLSACATNAVIAGICSEPYEPELQSKFYLLQLYLEDNFWETRENDKCLSRFMNRKMGQIDQISYFLHNKEVIICITPWNRDSSDETKRQVRACQRHLRKFGFTPSEETRNLLRSKRRVVVIRAAAGARARLALPCPGCSEPQPWKAGARFCLTRCWLKSSLLREQSPAPPVLPATKPGRTFGVEPTARLTQCVTS